MKNQQSTHGLYKLFIDELEDMYSSEHQIMESLAQLVHLAHSPDLKEALSKHLKETQNQVTRIENIFSILEMSPKEKMCKAMQGLLREAEDLTRNKTKSSALDAAIISAAQKVEHYEIASYGTLRSFAKHLDFDSEIVDLLQDTLDEEGAADKKLTKIAEGTIFSTGVNREAAEVVTAAGKKHKK
ncbi:MAG TPA: ferritin-like domain-containing protein [Waddliaceae bacterium]